MTSPVYVESEFDHIKRESVISEILGTEWKDIANFSEILKWRNEPVKITFDITIEGAKTPITERDIMLLEKFIRKCLYKLEEDGNS